MAGVVVRADILEDKDGKSRGIGTVTFEQSIEAVQAICILLLEFSSWGAICLNVMLVIEACVGKWLTLHISVS